MAKKVFVQVRVEILDGRRSPLAVFPGIRGSRTLPRSCEAYSSREGHVPVDPDWVFSSTRHATDEETQEMLRRLRNLGYACLAPIKRIFPHHWWFSGDKS